MKHLKTNYCVTLDIPVYIDGPDEFDDVDYFCEVIEGDPNGPRGWEFAHDDVLSAVMAALPMAEYVTVEVSDDGMYWFVDECPDGSIRYDLMSLTSDKSLRESAVRKRIHDLSKEMGRVSDPSRLLKIADQIRKLAETIA